MCSPDTLCTESASPNAKTKREYPQEKSGKMHMFSRSFLWRCGICELAEYLPRVAVFCGRDILGRLYAGGQCGGKQLRTSKMKLFSNIK